MSLCEVDDTSSEIRDLLNEELGGSRGRVVYDEETHSRYIEDLDCSVENFAAPVCMYVYMNGACIYVYILMKGERKSCV